MDEKDSVGSSGNGRRAGEPPVKPENLPFSQALREAADIRNENIQLHTIVDYITETAHKERQELDRVQREIVEVKRSFLYRLKERVLNRVDGILRNLQNPAKCNREHVDED